MNLTSPILTGILRSGEVPGDSLALRAGNILGLFADDDGGLGVVMSGLAGVAAALAVAILLSVYFRTGYRTTRDVVRHGFAAVLVLALVAFVAYDMRQAALAYLGINPAKPAVEYESRLPKPALSAISDTQIELRTDHQFGAWHLADRVSASINVSNDTTNSGSNDDFTICYRAP